MKIQNSVNPATGTNRGIAHAFARVALGFTMAAALFSTAAGAAEGVSNQTSVDTWKSVATQTITAGDVSFAYRELGKQNGGTPVVFLIHLAAVLDNWDPRIMDGIAAKHHVIAFDNRGISAVAGVTFYDMLRGFFTGQDAKQFLFFTRSPTGIEAGKAFLERLKERSENRDKEISVSAFLAQLEALRVWGQKAPADLSVVKHPVLVVNGDADRMVPTPNTHDLARRLANSTLIIYPDAGHGGIFQFHADFVPSALAFLGR